MVKQQLEFDLQIEQGKQSEKQGHQGEAPPGRRGRRRFGEAGSQGGA
jgi:hypothetical protein